MLSKHTPTTNAVNQKSVIVVIQVTEFLYIEDRSLFQLIYK